MVNTIKNKLLSYEPMEEWNEKKAKAKLSELYAAVVELADNNIEWYNTYRKVKGWWSKVIRIFAIVLLVFSTLMPYFSSIFGNERRLLYVGYILAGLGAGFLLVDRYYGFSNSWIRFVLTGMDLENTRNVFIQNWQVLYLSNMPLTVEGYAHMIGCLIKFHDVFSGAIKTETESWAKEFQQNLRELIAAMNNQHEQYKSTFQEDRNIAHSSKKPYSVEASGNVPIEVIQESIDKNYDSWKSTFNIVAVSTGKKITSGNNTDVNCLVFSPVDKLKAGDAVYIPIPKIIRFFSVNGHLYDIPTDVRASGSKIYASITPALLCDHIVPKRPGCSISRIGNTNAGTLGLKVYRGAQSYLLSCYHILCSPELAEGQFVFSPVSSIGDTTVVSPGEIDAAESIKIGKVIEGLLSEQMDCAIALINDPVDVIDDLCSIDKAPGKPITIGPEEARNRYPVKAVGRTSGLINGVIQEANTTCNINYWIKGQWEEKKLVGLISSDQATQGGDSGAPVLDDENNVLGVVIASSRYYSYILPIQRVLSMFSISLK